VPLSGFLKQKLLTARGGIVAAPNVLTVKVTLELRVDELPDSMGLEAWNLKQPKIFVSATVISKTTVLVLFMFPAPTTGVYRCMCVQVNVCCLKSYHQSSEISQ